MLQHYQDLLAQAIAEYELPAEPKSLYDPIRYILSIGGKRIRPVLVLLATDMFCGKPELGVNTALAIEVFHNFTLIHDDIMDKAPRRRGNETVHVKWDENVAILSGDVMMVEANKNLTKTDGPHLKAVLDVFNATAQAVCEGQMLDMEFEQRNDVTLDEYINMIRLKTAVLLGGALQLGAIIGGSSVVDADNIYKAGVALGTGFQIKDDLLDVYGNPEKFGKQVGGDILTNKKTWLLLTALKRAGEGEGDELRALLTNSASGAEGDAKVKRVTEIFTTLGIPESANEIIRRYYDEALGYIGALSIGESQKDVLRQLANAILNREL